MILLIIPYADYVMGMVGLEPTTPALKVRFSNPTEIHSHLVLLY